MSTPTHQNTSSDLTLNELVFCYQYCTFTKSQPSPSPHAELVENFLDQYHLPRDVDYPVDWLKDGAGSEEAGDRFVQIVGHLPLADKRKESFFWRSAKHIGWYLAVGFASHQLLKHLGVNAAPRLHLDNVTGHEFQLYMLDDDPGETAAFEAYLSGNTFNVVALTFACAPGLATANCFVGSNLRPDHGLEAIGFFYAAGCELKTNQFGGGQELKKTGKSTDGKCLNVLAKNQSDTRAVSSNQTVDALVWE